MLSFLLFCKQSFSAARHIPDDKYNLIYVVTSLYIVFDEPTTQVIARDMSYSAFCHSYWAVIQRLSILDVVDVAFNWARLVRRGDKWTVEEREKKEGHGTRPVARQAENGTGTKDDIQFAGVLYQIFLRLGYGVLGASIVGTNMTVE